MHLIKLHCDTHRRTKEDGIRAWSANKSLDSILAAERGTYHTDLPEGAIEAGVTVVKHEHEAAPNREAQRLEDPRVHAGELHNLGRKGAGDEVSHALTAPLRYRGVFRQSPQYVVPRYQHTGALPVEKGEDQSDILNLEGVVVEEVDHDGALVREGQNRGGRVVLGCLKEVRAVLKDVLRDDLIGEILASLQALEERVKLVLDFRALGSGNRHVLEVIGHCWCA